MRGSSQRVQGGMGTGQCGTPSQFCSPAKPAGQQSACARRLRQYGTQATATSAPVLQPRQTGWALALICWSSGRTLRHTWMIRHSPTTTHSPPPPPPNSSFHCSHTPGSEGTQPRLAFICLSSDRTRLALGILLGSKSGGKYLLSTCGMHACFQRFVNSGYVVTGEGCGLAQAAAAGRERSVSSIASLHNVRGRPSLRSSTLPLNQAHLAFTHLGDWFLLLSGAQWQKAGLDCSTCSGGRQTAEDVGGGGRAAAAARTAGGCACLGGERKRTETFYDVHLLTAAAKIQQGAPAQRLASAQQQRQALRAPVADWEVVITLLARPRAPKWPPLPARLVGRLLSALLRLAAQQPVAREMREHLSEAHRSASPCCRCRACRPLPLLVQAPCRRRLPKVLCRPGPALHPQKSTVIHTIRSDRQLQSGYQAPRCSADPNTGRLRSHSIN